MPFESAIIERYRLRESNTEALIEYIIPDECLCVPRGDIMGAMKKDESSWVSLLHGFVNTI